MILRYTKSKLIPAHRVSIVEGHLQYREFIPMRNEEITVALDMASSYTASPNGAQASAAV